MSRYESEGCQKLDIYIFLTGDVIIFLPFLIQMPGTRHRVRYIIAQHIHWHRCNQFIGSECVDHRYKQHLVQSPFRCIKRIVFFSLMKPCINDKGEKEMDLISTSQAHQIGGRAGRYRTAYEQGEVTTFKHDDLATLKEIISYPIDPIVVGSHEHLAIKSHSRWVACSTQC